ncbi:MAG: permease [Bradyrhizobiaceae bacterium]|nr:permease [Bradyrhizobiaceae bacterium]
MSQPATYTWFAAHELKLAWRDWLSMLMAGKRGRIGAVAIGLGAFVVFMHVIALIAVGPFAGAGRTPDKATLAILSAFVLLAWCLMISQAMESVTRAFYSRGDLDLILSSPATTRRLFAVRIGTLALSSMSMAVFLAGPFANVLAVLGGPRWLFGYGVFAAMGATAAAIAVTATVFLFRAIGPRRTRFAAQVLAAVVGAAFVIGLQMVAILSYGTFSRIAFIFSQGFIDSSPDASSLLYLPARAILGDPSALLAVMVTGIGVLGAAIGAFASGFGEHAIAAASVSQHVPARKALARPFRGATPAGALRRKELTLLRRDPWLMSQTLMQLLYLAPPALLLWRSFGDGIGISLLLVPVLVMAAGQLAGGLAWLAISGEDALDLVATAPVPRGFVMRAKIEAVLLAVAIVFAPLLAAFAIIMPVSALVTAAFAAVAAASATAIQFWFRSQVKRSQFRRRHTSSRIATFAEAFSSIGWAATAALVAHGTFAAIGVAILTLAVLWVARLISPHRTVIGER